MRPMTTNFCKNDDDLEKINTDLKIFFQKKRKRKKILINRKRIIKIANNMNFYI